MLIIFLMTVLNYTCHFYAETAVVFINWINTTGSCKKDLAAPKIILPDFE